MNYVVQKRRFASESELLAYLVALPFSPGEHVGIIAGHFMLVYDDQADCLVPMVHQDATNPKVRMMSAEMAGDFPLKTFEVGVRLANEYRARALSSKLALVVNDHIFQTPGWSPQNLKDKSRAGELRRRFYRSKAMVPRAYESYLDRMGWKGPDVFLVNHQTRRDDEGILPPESLCFSETALRRRFDKATRPGLAELPMFIERRLPGGAARLYFRPESNFTEFCLTENGECGCGGEIMELLIQLGQLPSAGLVLFIPSECVRAVIVGVNAFFSLPSGYKGKLRSIVVVDGFGGIGKNARADSDDSIATVAFSEVQRSTL